jgi:hypothetical protein
MNELYTWEYKLDADSKYEKLDRKMSEKEIVELAEENNWYSYRVYSY